MSRAEIIIKEQFDRAWSSRRQFEDYERNRVLARWLGGSRHEGKKILDVGCGEGVICEYLASRGFDVSGVDLSEQGVAQTRERVAGTFKVANAEDPMPFADSSFDYVFWGDNVEHLYDPTYTLGEIRRVLKPGGRLIVSCPNVGLLKFRLIYLVRGSMPRHEGHDNPPWAWHHIRFFTPPILRSFLSSNGYRVSRLSGAARGPIAGFLARYFPGWFATVLVSEAVSTKKQPARLAA